MDETLDRKRMVTYDMYSSIKYWVVDIDGTMTDGNVIYDNYGNELKKFSTRDGIGLLLLDKLGMEVIVITGRSCFATEKRMKELHVKYLFQNIKNKKDFLLKFMENNNIHSEQVAYIGDDLNDYSAMKLASIKACPANACEEIQMLSDYVSLYKGGEGAVRDFICYVLKKMELWDRLLESVCEAGI